MKTSGTEWRAQMWIYTCMHTLFLTKALEIYDGEKRASSTVIG
jgi:hypothetical protein